MNKFNDVDFFFVAFYGVIFAKKEEAAFSNHRLWESIGFIIAYAYGSFICNLTFKISSKIIYHLYYF